MVIGVTAPSGNVGRFIVRDLVRAGIRPRLLAHRPASVEPALREYVDLRVVDLRDSSDVDPAMDGVDVLYLTVPANQDPDPIAGYTRIGSVVSRAVARQHVGRVVFQSSVGAEKRHGAGEIDGLAQVEQQLERSGASVVHLRCGYFFTNLLGMLNELENGRLNILLPTDRPMPWVAPIDIARVASTFLLRPDWTGRLVRAVHGPEDLSWDQVARIIRDATGHEIEVTRIDDDSMRSAMAAAGLATGQIEAIIGMSSGLREDFVAEQPRDVTTTTDTSLGAWAYDELRPALAASGRAES